MSLFRGLLPILAFALLHAAPSSQYHLKKGWNTLCVPTDGIDIVATFLHTDIETLYHYDAERNLLALYRADAIGASVPGHLLLETLEPGEEFSLFTATAATIDIVPSGLTGTCLAYANTSDYLHIEALSGKEAVNASGDIKLVSRYLPYQKRGFYRDSRVTLIYPKLPYAGDATFRYGPANPRILIDYAKAYENRMFYLYDHFQKRCFTGIFPSQKVPPFSDLRPLD